MLWIVAESHLWCRGIEGGGAGVYNAGKTFSGEITTTTNIAFERYSGGGTP